MNHCNFCDSANGIISLVGFEIDSLNRIPGFYFLTRGTSCNSDLHSKILDTRPPLGIHILSISRGFLENLAKSYAGAPGGLAL